MKETGADKICTANLTTHTICRSTRPEHVQQTVYSHEIMLDSVIEKSLMKEHSCEIQLIHL